MEFSHIRRKVEFTGEVSTMTLDMYYQKHVARRCRPMCSKWRRHFKRMHYFAPKKMVLKPMALLEQRHRLNELCRRIAEVKHMIEYKIQVDMQQKLLDQLKADIARQEALKASIKLELESQHQPLVMMIGDEVLYDEDYKRDPLWK
ncbi:hypothetical protein KR038_006801 [Drosophila bunnanda]|nr:hypothetical protein KR038_006801 [Drosophila bunnanda]